MSAPARDRGVPRALGPHHFAFLRGWVKGLPLEELGGRYLESGVDLRVTRSTLRWLRDALIALAGRSPRPALAALLRRSPRGPDGSAAPGTTAAVVGGSTPVPPTLEQFAAQFPDGFYSEAELLALFAAAYPPVAPEDRARERRAAQRSRLIERQLAALAYLEPLLAQPPQLGDRVAAWFAPAVAARLEWTGLGTLLDLHTRYQNRGGHWWRTVPRLGEVGARRIEQWWAQHRASLPPLTQLRRVRREVSSLYPVTETASSSVSAVAARHLPSVPTASSPIAATGLSGANGSDPPPPPSPPLSDATASQIISPIELLAVPNSLSGRQGRNRQQRERCALAADDDLAAIQVWLARRPVGSPTWRSYRNEAERFLLWAIVERRKAFSDLTTEDCLVYQGFLADPQPAARWINPRPARRWSPHWRPFAGALSGASAGHAQSVLRSLCEWLVRQRYLDTNPWDGVAALGPPRERLSAGRMFPRALWEVVEAALDALDDTPANARLRFSVRFLYATGLRRAELTSLRLGQFAFDEAVGAWILTTTGKGRTVREVPLAADTVDLLTDYLRVSRPEWFVAIDGSLAAMLERAPPLTPLLRRLDAERDEEAVIDVTSVYRPIKAFFRGVAEETSGLSDRDRSRLARASTHWLRHTFASHAIADEAPLDVIRDILGHASIATTSVYLTSEMHRRARAMEDIAGRRSRSIG